MLVIIPLSCRLGQQVFFDVFLILCYNHFITCYFSENTIIIAVHRRAVIHYQFGGHTPRSVIGPIIFKTIIKLNEMRKNYGI